MGPKNEPKYVVVEVPSNSNDQPREVQDANQDSIDIPRPVVVVLNEEPDNNNNTNCKNI